MHVAFLASLPSPTFDTCFNIDFLGKSILINEPSYNELPIKDDDAIKVLFDVLNLKSILYCVKAILLGKTLFLISSQS